MSAEARFEPEQILRCLNAHGVRYVIVGGFAVAAHGVVRATADLDLVVERSRENAEALERALRELEARNLDGRADALTREALVRRADRRLHTSYGELHLLHEVGGVPDYRELQPPAQFVLAAGATRTLSTWPSSTRLRARTSGATFARPETAELNARRRRRLGALRPLPPGRRRGRGPEGGLQ